MRSKADNKVKGHSSNFMLTDAKFRVGQAGRERVLREGVKNVHAGVEGTLTDKLIRGPWIPVKYNPKIDQGFIRKDTNEPVTTAKVVKFTPEGVFMKAAFINSFMKMAIDMGTLRKFTNKIPTHIRAKSFLDPAEFSKSISNISDNLKKKVKDFNQVKIRNRAPANVIDIGPVFNPAKNKIIAKGDILKNPSLKHLNPGNMTGNQREFLNRTLLAHEIDEGKTMRKMRLKNKINRGMTQADFARETFNTHASPGIILREGNLLASAHQDISEPAKKVLNTIRQADQTVPSIQEVMPQYEHGKTRLSRHAIKNISKSIKNRHKAKIDEFLLANGINKAAFWSGFEKRAEEDKTLYRPKPSSRPGKKYMVYVKGDSGNPKLIHFGATGYKHNYSEEAKKNFRARHNCEGADKNTPKWWACNYLWGTNQRVGTKTNKELIKK